MLSYCWKCIFNSHTGNAVGSSVILARHTASRYHINSLCSPLLTTPPLPLLLSHHSIQVELLILQALVAREEENVLDFAIRVCLIQMLHPHKHQSHSSYPTTRIHIILTADRYLWRLLSTHRTRLTFLKLTDRTSIHLLLDALDCQVSWVLKHLLTQPRITYHSNPLAFKVTI